jgi:hypothetical protein
MKQLSANILRQSFYIDILQVRINHGLMYACCVGYCPLSEVYLMYVTVREFILLLYRQLIIIILIDSIDRGQD